MIFVSLASGSSGNCTLLATDTAKILIDCGISAKRIDESLKALGLCAEKLDGIFLTHEHTDHIKGLKRLCSAYGLPVYGSEGTLRSLPRALRDEYFSYAGREFLNPVYQDRPVKIGGLSVLPFAISHDAAQPFGYRIEGQEALSAFDEETQGGCRRFAAAVATDMGYYDDRVRDHLLGLDTALLESNHDRGMLANGPYPVSLKRRIMSREGHLSNNSCGRLLSEIAGPSLKQVFLGHLSRDNNTPQLALATVEQEYRTLCQEADREPRLPKLCVAPHDGLSQIFRM